MNLQVFKLQFPEIIANVTGGTNPISYLWNTGETTSSITLNNGNFYVDVYDLNNCNNSHLSLLIL